MDGSEGSDAEDLTRDAMPSESILLWPPIHNYWGSSELKGEMGRENGNLSTCC